MLIRQFAEITWTSVSFMFEIMSSYEAVFNKIQTSLAIARIQIFAMLVTNVAIVTTELWTENFALLAILN